MTEASVGIIGGSGVYDLDGLQNPRWVSVDTPFGQPSDDLLLGTLDGVSLAFLPRHGRGHRYTPSTVNYRANVWALKSLGVHSVVSLSAVGSLREDIAPGTLVLVDQFIDRTHGRVGSFFGPGLVAHVSMAEPTCGWLRGLLGQAADHAGDAVTQGGTYLAMEGPQFSTKAESHLYRQWGCSVVGMTNMPEAKLVREAEIKALFCTTNPIPVKAALELRGWPVGAPRLPLLSANAAVRQRLSETLAALRPT